MNAESLDAVCRTAKLIESLRARRDRLNELLAIANAEKAAVKLVIAGTSVDREFMYLLAETDRDTLMVKVVDAIAKSVGRITLELDALNLWPEADREAGKQ